MKAVPGLIVPVISLRGLAKPWPWFVYVGREQKYCGNQVVNLPAHPLANPFKIEADTQKNRIDSLDKYEKWIDGLKNPQRDQWLWETLCDTEGGRIPLACWCGKWNGWSPVKPLCHAVVIAERIVARFGKDFLD